MQINQFILISGLCIIVIIGSSGCVEDKQNLPNNSIVEPTEKIVNTSFMYHFPKYEIKKNSEISFKAGSRFVYQSPGYLQHDGWQDVFTVERIEKVDGRDAYVVINERDARYAETLFEKTKYYSTHHTTIYYYNKKDGILLKIQRVDENTGEIKTIEEGGKDFIWATGSFFAYWMLGLSDDIKWEIPYSANYDFLNTTYHKKLEFRVIGREKVNNRECFKVEERIINLDKGNIVEQTNYYWVDVKRRMLVKKEGYGKDKVKLFEEDLVSKL